MSRIVILDSGPVGLLTQRKDVLPAEVCRRWQKELLASGARVILPEIVDYEVRRELLRIKSVNGLARLDHLTAVIEYLPLTKAAMRKAAELWADVRQKEQPTADPKELDGDVILAAQALMLGEADVVVATTNAGHLSRFVAAQSWPEVQ